MKELEYPFDGEALIKQKKRLRKALLAEEVSRVPVRIAILGGSTTNDVKQLLELFLLNYGIAPTFYESEYNQFYQDGVFGNEELNAFAPEIVYVHTSTRNVIQFPALSMSADEVNTLLDEEYARFAAVWEGVRKRYHCTIIQNNFEPPYFRLLGNAEATDTHGRIAFLNALNERFYQYAREHESFYIQDIAYLAACYGLDRWADPFYWYMYKYAVAVPAIPSLAFNLANQIKSIYGKNKKALVLDLDNTLWGGIVGDDGAENLSIGQETPEGQAFTEFQEYLKAQKQLGVLLNVDSKNDYENAIAGIHHPDGVLKEDDFICIKANWEPKDRNLVEIAKELNLLPESMVFLDDNPAERAIVSAQVKGAAVPELSRPEYYIQCVDRSGFFEVTKLSEDDKKRNEMYRQNAARAKQEAAFENYGDYLKSLEMHAEIRAFAPLYMARIAQLTNKSNQFNLTTKRYTQAEIEEAAADKTRVTLYGKLVDKFGDNGVVSIVIGRLEDKVCHIELWLMSCRVLKRDMEFAMMDTLVHRCRETGVQKIVGYYYPTAKNGMVREFYAGQGFTKVSEDENGNTVWEFQISDDYEAKNQVIEVEE